MVTIEAIQRLKSCQKFGTMANETVNNTLNDLQREYQDFLDDDNDEGLYRVSFIPQDALFKSGWLFGLIVRWRVRARRLGQDFFDPSGLRTDGDII